MFTANDLRKKLKEATVCKGLDAWIGEFLAERFMDAEGETVHITPHEIEYIRGWKQVPFIKEMHERGFDVKFYCEDRPCGTCWYKISI